MAAGLPSADHAMLPRLRPAGLAAALVLAARLGAQAPAPAAPQAATAPTPAPATGKPSCDCATGEQTGELRNLAAFAPLGFIGALAAAGAPALFAGGEPARVAPTIAPQSPIALRGLPLPQVEVPVVEGGRVAVTERPADAPVDSLSEAGLRAPDTATPLPSVLLLGSGLVALGTFALARARG